MAGTVFLTACIKPAPQHEELPDSVLKTAENAATVPQPVSELATEAELQIERDPLLIPAEDEEYIAKVLMTGTFHAGEVWENVEKENWFGLFCNNVCALSKTGLVTKRVNDGIIDEEGQKTGWEITTSKAGNSLLLIAGLDFLTEREVPSIELPATEIFPGDTVEFDYLNTHYTLFATGVKRRSDVLNYKLYLIGDKNGKMITQLLVAQPAYDDEMTDIIFAGDIDGDQFLDLIIDTSGHYNATMPTLYLSRPAENSQLLRIAGQHISVGC